MDYQNSDSVFQTVPKKKLDNAIEDVMRVHSENGVLTKEGGMLVEALQNYTHANIPVDYWFLEMDKFTGDKNLVKRYEEIVSDIAKAYKDGLRVCFAGSHGCGKTMVCSCILKRVVETGKFNALYVNLTDIVNIMASPRADDKYEARKQLLSVDFLVIDEFDQRFMGTDNAADLFGRILEPTMRARMQNKLPLIFCTNSTNVVSSFNGPLRSSIESLMRMFKTVPVLGGDFRAGGNK
jgi:DNA replication protein DnaC